jgi:aryl-alcohol dehydrogenase-like predicted oxidoreductase
MLHRPIGASGPTVSALSLGSSWRTFERIGRAQGVAVLDAARDAGVDFLEVARDDDETANATVPTGSSERVFGEILRASAYDRDAVTISTRLGWEGWPERTAVQRLEAALQRTGLERFDLLSCDVPPAALSLDEVVGQVGALLAAGLVRAWGVVGWPAERIATAGRIALQQGVAPPAMAQLPYSVLDRDGVESPETEDALELCGASLIAASPLAGGLLAGGDASLDVGDAHAAQRLARGREAAAALHGLAQELATTPASLAIAFALTHPRAASVLTAATRPEQVVEDAAAVELPARLTDDQLARLRAIGS